MKIERKQLPQGGYMMLPSPTNNKTLGNDVN